MIALFVSNRTFNSNYVFPQDPRNKRAKIVEARGCVSVAVMESESDAFHAVDFGILPKPFFRCEEAGSVRPSVRP